MSTFTLNDQVYSLPAALLTWPSFLHVAPALTAAFEMEALVLKVKRVINIVASNRLIEISVIKEGAPDKGAPCALSL
jgi:hypothetical protein